MVVIEWAAELSRDADRSLRLRPVVALRRVTTGSRTARQAARAMAGSRPSPTLAELPVPAESARLDGLQLSSCGTASEGPPSCRGLPGAADFPMEQGGKPQVAGWRIRRPTPPRVKPGAACPFGWRRLRPQDSMPLAIRPAVRGSDGARANRLPDRMGRRSDTASRLVCSTLRWSMGVSGRLARDCACKRGRDSTIPKADVPAFLPIEINLISLSTYLPT